MKKKAILILILLLSAFLFIQIPHIRATPIVYWSDNFEDCNIADWFTSSTGAGSVTCSNGNPHSGSYSMRIYSPLIETHAYARYLSLSGVPTIYHIQTWIYIDDNVLPSDMTQCLFGIHDGSSYNFLLTFKQVDSEYQNKIFDIRNQLV